MNNGINGSMPIPVSEVSQLIQNFIEFKRSTGLKYRSEEKTFRYFMRYCNEHYPCGELSEDVVFNWINETDNRSLKTKSNYAGTMAAWSKHLFSLGYIQLRMPNIRHSKNTAFIPHIFTRDELNAIWDAVDRIVPSKAYPNLHRCIPVLFRLLYSCGLRISEALAITADDISFDTNVIILKHTKYDKERLIPMSESMANTLKKYINTLSEQLSHNTPVFYYRIGEPLVAHSVYGRFRKTLADSGIPYEGKLRGPRLHDFRYPNHFKIQTIFI